MNETEAQGGPGAWEGPDEGQEQRRQRLADATREYGKKHLNSEDEGAVSWPEGLMKIQKRDLSGERSLFCTRPPDSLALCQ